MQRPVVNVEERLPLLQWLPLSAQHLFAMFGATVLVPMLTGLDPSIALLTSGLGTLVFTATTGGKVPAYLGSSFAFIAPLIYAQEQWGMAGAMAGAFVAGLVYILVSLVISRTGTAWLERLLSPVVIGPVIMVIGLGLAGTALDMAGLIPEEGDAVNLLASSTPWVALFTLAVAVSSSVFFRGFTRVIPILLGIVAGYALSMTLGLVDTAPVAEAGWLGLPDFASPIGTLVREPGLLIPAGILMAPVALVTLAEHIGDVLVLGNVAGRDFIKRPGLHRTILGDGLATGLASMLGGPPNTTYGENIGVLAITRVYSVYVTAGAGAMAVLLAFVPKLGAVLYTIPEAVMGGVSILLFGTIAAAGVRTVVQSQVDFSDRRNLIIAAVILILGVGDASVALGPVTLHGMPLAAIVGVLLNLVLPHENRQEEVVEPGSNEAETGDAPTYST